MIGDRERPFGPLLPDDVTSGEYRGAFDDLKKFIQLDPSTIRTVKDLEAAVFPVGRNIQSLIVGGGHLQETEFNYPHPEDPKGIERRAIDSKWVIRKPVGDHFIFATGNKDGVLVVGYKIEKGVEKDMVSTFNFSLPFTNALVGPDPAINMCRTNAGDFRSGKVVAYFPTQDTDDPDVQQGFFRVVQAGVGEILGSVQKPLAPPTANI